MSRRKQSNPKPIKRSEEEEEEEEEEEIEVTSVLHIPPTNDLCLHQLSGHSSTVKAQRFVPSGSKYGPYKCVAQYDTSADDNHHNQEDCVKIVQPDGVEITYRLLDEMGSWLQHVKQPRSREMANAQVSIDDGSLCLAITADVEEGCEVKASFVGEENLQDKRFEATQESIPKSIIKIEPSSPATSMETPEESAGKLDLLRPVSAGNRMSESSEEIDSNPDAFTSTYSTISGDKMVYVPEEDSSSKDKSEGINEEQAMKDDNELISDRFRYMCMPCGIVFSSSSTLMAHQTFYCVHRDRNDDHQLKAHNPAAATGTSDGHNSAEEDTVGSQKVSEVIEQKKRRRDSFTEDSNSTSEMNDQKYKKSGQIFSCVCCSYTTDKKNSLSRHMRMHSSPSPVNKTLIDNQMLAAAMAERQLVLMRSYCAECDIQFTSHKNFSVHKQIYCNTRRVQPRSAHVTASQSPRAKSPVAQSSSSMSPIDPSITPWNFLQQNAFSSSPLILVPCSYVPGRGLVPASNIMFQNGEDFPHKASSNEIQSLNDASTGTADRIRAISASTAESTENSGNSREKVVMSSPRLSSDSELSIIANKRERPADETANSQSVPEAPEEMNNDAVDGPLDLSVSKGSHIEDNEKENYNIMETNDASESSSVISKRGANALGQSSHAEKTFSICPKSEPSSDVEDNGQVSPGKCLEGINSTAPIIIKQGVSNCAECNIVFYKHENYLAHKQFYCSSRNEKLLPLSMDNKDIKSSNTASSKVQIDPKSQLFKEHGKRILGNPLIQFFCAPCGIKFTSIKNLQAHQTYYCPNREIISQGKNIQTETKSSRSPVDLPNNSAFTCMSCKTIYSSELALRKHLCTNYSPPNAGANSPPLLKSPPPTLIVRGSSERQTNALRCIVCGYRGHTLRGMKSHVRGHMSQFENASNVLEEDIYAFVVHEKTINNNHEDGDGSENFIMKLTSKSLSPNGHTDGQPQFIPNDLGYSCDFCSYSSSYRGNVIRHKRLVHKDRMDVVSGDDGTDVKNSRNSDVESAKIDDKSEVCKLPIRTNSTSPSEDVKSDVRSSNNNNLSDDINQISKTNGRQKNFCNSCRISFSYLPSYVAHKQFYCTARATPDGSRLIEEQAAL